MNRVHELIADIDPMSGAAKTLRQKWWRVRTTRQQLEPSQLRTPAPGPARINGTEPVKICLDQNDDSRGSCQNWQLSQTSAELATVGLCDRSDDRFSRRGDLVVGQSSIVGLEAQSERQTTVTIIDALPSVDVDQI